MQITKRDGTKQAINFNKIATRIRQLCTDMDKRYIDPTKVAQTVIAGAYDGISTEELDQLAAETAASMAIDHPDYALLAGRLATSTLHKEANHTFFEGLQMLNADERVSDETVSIAEAHADEINKLIDYDNDYTHDFFSIKTLERSYLLRDNAGKIIERPQDLWMRVSIGIHGADWENVEKTYKLLSDGYMTHATPTLFNAGTDRPQMSSCFLLDMDDNIEGLFKTLSDAAKISKWAGGIGVNLSKIRGKDSFIGGTGGKSDGIVPLLKTFNETMRWINQGGRRKGSLAFYLEPWHSDIEAFLDAKKPHGAEELRARDLFYAIYTNDVFMERVEADGAWSLMCPNECPNLTETYGAEFRALYEGYEAAGKHREQIPARKLWAKIVEATIETGVPYMTNKDRANETSMQKNIGIIRSSNLCNEILLHTSKDEIAVCNLASIALPKFVEGREINFEKLSDVAYQAIVNLNSVIDRNFYPVPETKNSNMRNRPIGLGVQGLADVFAMLKVPFESEDATRLNAAIFESIYYGAVKASADLAVKHGAYSRFEGSPWSEGTFHFDQWSNVQFSGRYDWDALKAQVKSTGVYNSVLTALMPTASTSQILGNNECFEPFTSNLYLRRTLSGEFVMVNKHLIDELTRLGMWNDVMRNKILEHNGSVQSIIEIPEEVRDVYKTVWEIKQKAVIELAAGRAPFIDQTQSMNLFFDSPNMNNISSALMYGWKQGLKTLSYYIRSNAAASAVKFTVPKEATPEEIVESVACSLDDPDSCISCGS